MKLADFHYDLPPSAIAQAPVEPRDHSRLLILDRESRAFQHKRFYELPDYLRPGDLLVTNATKVFPARLRGRKSTGGKVEALLISSFPAASGGPVPLEYSSTGRPETAGDDAMVWRALVRGTTRPTGLVFPEGLEARMVERLAEGEWILEVPSNHLRAYLDRHGEMPLPPYIKRPLPRAADLDRYQTVYAEKEGAVAAPTAGFHFTPGLLEKIRAKGVTIRSIVLHVGWGTFRPIRTETIEQHRMLPESYEVSEVVAADLNAARREGRRIVAVGTTAVRTLETVCDPEGKFHAGSGQASLYIYPGYQFKAVDALITNFHLPDSTPLLLANAFYAFKPSLRGARRRSNLSGQIASLPVVARNDSISYPFALRFAYEEAIRQGYRFYSYGDAMFIQ